jgi:hypothetical protein
MDGPWLYEIRVAERLTDRWPGWFDGLAILNNPDGETILYGLLADQAALLGVLNRVHGLNLTLISVHRISPGE